jgi:hypothetical protein
VEDADVSETPPYGDPQGEPEGQPYGQPQWQQPPYGQSPYGAVPGPDHPQATTVLVLGILGLVLCGLIAPFAWVMGNRVVAEIDASGGRIGGRSAANAGRICGIVGSVLIGLGLLVGLLFVFGAVVAASG